MICLITQSGCSLVVRIPRCGRGDLGSNPSSHSFFLLASQLTFARFPFLDTTSQDSIRSVHHCRSTSIIVYGMLHRITDTCFARSFSRQVFIILPPNLHPHHSPSLSLSHYLSLSLSLSR
jgi:hypothetical protein